MDKPPVPVEGPVTDDKDTSADSAKVPTAPPPPPPAEPAPASNAHKEECPPCKAGAPAWMATFADMATLLMAFFVLILSFAEMNVPKFKQINGSLKNSFGIQRIIPVVESPKAQSIVARHFTPSVAQPTPLVVIQQQTTDDRKDEVELKTDVSPEAQQAVDTLKQALAEEIRRGEVEVRAQGEQVVVEMLSTPGGTGQQGSARGGLGATGQRSSGQTQTGQQASGAANTANRASGAADTGTQAAGASAAGTQAAANASQGQKAAGMVSQGEIEFYAKVADAQSQVQAGVSVLDRRAGNGRSTGQNDRGTATAIAQTEYERIRRELEQEIRAGQAEVERDGAKIIIRLAEQGSFRSGSADLQPAFGQVLEQVGRSIASSQGRIYIEGHTDNVPVVFNDRFKSNWDLSGARAGAVADYLSSRSALPAGRMSVSGYADTRPLESNDSADGRSRNRRIEIIVDGSS